MFVCPECGLAWERDGFCANDGRQLATAKDPLLGTEVGRYRFARVLGEGGMGRVYLAVQPAIGSRVAIKVLSEECSRSPELLDRFFAEARAVNLICHEHIVGVLDHAQLADGRPFLVMEFIEGETLADVIRRGPAPLGGIVALIGEVLAALAAAHALGIVHRDLKPDNVLVTAAGHAKVLDFGIAKLAPGLTANSPRTRTGAIMGTPAYMAPEQISGAGKVDARSDVYAAGIVLFEAITGRQPFTGLTLFDVMRAHLEQPVPSARALRPELPEAIERVVATALAKDPGQRYATAAAMGAALAAAAATLSAGQWQPLSSRPGAVMPRVITPPAADLAAASTALAAPTLKTSRRWRTVLLASGAVVAVGALVLVALLALGVGGHFDPAPPVPASSPAVAAAPAPVAPTPVPAPAVPAPAVPARAAPARVPAPAHVPAPSHPAAPPPATGGSSDEPSAATIAEAAKHGVIIGKNVHLGPGVQIGTSPPTAAPASASRPADYNPRRFDPIAYLPKATALAQQLVPDAALTRFEFDPVYADGHADLTTGEDHYFQFRSPERSVKPPGLPGNVEVARPCIIYVEVTASGATAEVRKNDTCDAHLVRWPRCSFAGVWKLALAGGTPGDWVARVGWLEDSKWFFDTDPGNTGKYPGVQSFADRCP